MQILLLAQIPTPTPFPTVNPADVPFSLPSVDLWDFTDDAIQAWNFAGNWTPALQAILLVLLVLFGVFTVVTFLRKMTNSDTGDGGGTEE